MTEESKTKKCVYRAETIQTEPIADVLADCYAIILAARAERLAVSIRRHSTGGDLDTPAQVESGDEKSTLE